MKNKRNGSAKFLVVVLAVTIALITITNITFTFVVCFSQVASATTLTSAEKIESTIIANCISIIGIAVAIWAGLNIIQVLEKGKLDELRKEVSQYSQERKTTNHNKFLSLLHANNDLLSNYLYRQFSTLDEKVITSEQFFILGEIERALCLVIECHNNKTPYDVEYIKTILIKLEKLGNDKTFQDTPKIIQDYIALRKGEFCFYLGYKANKENCRKYFRKALSSYFSVFTDLEKSLQKDEEIVLLDDGNEALTYYMLNTIGECYSKIIQIKEHHVRDEEIALKCYKKIGSNVQNINSDTSCYREVYFRNYGCLLERIYPNEYTKERIQQILFQYQKAIDIALDEKKINSNVFYVWLSYHHKILNSVFYKFNKKQKLYELIQSPNISSYDELLAFTRKTELYAQIATNCFPERLEFRKFQAFIHRDFCLIHHYNNQQEESKKYLSKLCNSASEFKMLYDKDKRDDYIEQIIQQSEELSNLF